MNKQYIISERAHFMCPNMQFAIAATFQSPYEKDKVHKVMEQLMDAHPFLKCRIAKDQEGRYYYEHDDKLEPDISYEGNKENFINNYQEKVRDGWNVLEESLLKIVIYTNEQNCTILFIAHHLLCDGRGLLGLVEEFANCYVSGVKPSYAEERLLTCVDDLPQGSDLPWISKCIVSSANKNWNKEQQTISYEEYLSFEKEYLKQNEYEWDIRKTTSEEVNRIKSECQASNVSVNDYLIADMMIEENTTKVLIAADIRKYIENYVSGSMGNYSTAFGVICKEKDRNPMNLAKAVNKQVHKIINSPRSLFLVLSCYFRMNPELLDAVAIASLSTRVSEAGRFVGESMFGFKARNGCSISNLGKIDNPNLSDAIFIPPLSPANRVMQGVLTINGQMNICTGRYKDK